MHIEHAALWTKDLQRLVAFYVEYFGAVAGERYFNPRRQFTSYFLSFSSGARLEVMSTSPTQPAGARSASSPTGDAAPTQPPPSGSAPTGEGPGVGAAHLAFATGSEAQVDALTARLRTAGYPVLDGPRRTGDGYYESVVLDPDGNRVEITV